MRGSQMAPLFVVVGCFALGVGIACSSERSSAPSLPAAASSAPTATPHPNLTPERIDLAIRFRTTSGLRSDRAWVTAVATNPVAQAGIVAYSVPLMPEEVQLLNGRARTTDAVMDAVATYGQSHPDEWAGAYTERPSGIVVVMVLGEVEAHRSALALILSPSALVDVRPARWALSELKRLQHQLARDGWLESQRYHPLEIGVELADNVVALLVSTNDPNAVPTILEHFGADGRLVVSTDGTGAHYLPKGAIRGAAVDADGKPVAGLDIELNPDIEVSLNDIGHATSADGSFEFKKVPAVGYEVVAFRTTDDSGKELEGTDRIRVGSVRAVVQGGAITTVVVVVER